MTAKSSEKCNKFALFHWAVHSERSYDTEKLCSQGILRCSSN